MSEKQFAVVNTDDEVVAFCVIDTENEDSLNVAKEVYKNALFVEVDDLHLFRIGSHHKDGVIYHRSFVRNSQGEWESPIPYPTDGCYYEWIEDDEYSRWNKLTPFPSWIWDEETRSAI